MSRSTFDSQKNPHPSPLSDYRARGKISGSLFLAFLFFITYCALLIFGYLAFRHEGTTVRGNEFSQDRAIFATINAGTLTGFQSVQNLNELAPQGRIVVELLTIGGTLFSLTVGGMAAVRILRMNYSDLQVITAAIGFTVCAMLAGGFSLYTEKNGLFFPLFLSLSSFSNSGLYAGSLPDSLGWKTHAVLMPLSVVGGLGLPVLMELIDRVRGKKSLSRHTITALSMTGAIYMIALVALACLQWPAEMSTDAIRRVIGTASLQAINGRGVGFSFQFATDLARNIQWILIALMLIGGSPAGTAGGLKTTTLAELARGIYAALRGRPVNRSFGIACVWTIAYLSLILSSTLALLSIESQAPLERMLFLATSATGNVGLSHEPVTIVGSALHILSATMLLGRLLPLLILWWMALMTKDADVAVG